MHVEEAEDNVDVELLRFAASGAVPHTSPLPLPSSHSMAELRGHAIEYEAAGGLLRASTMGVRAQLDAGRGAGPSEAHPHIRTAVHLLRIKPNLKLASTLLAA